MDSVSFPILDAVRRSYLFAWQTRSYLLRLSGPVIALTAGTGFFVQTYRPAASVAEAFLWSLPANALLAWFLFAVVRLLLLGERIDRLPDDAAFLSRRRAAMRLSVLLSLAFNTAVTAGAMAARTLLELRPDALPQAGILGGVLIAAGLFWGLRFSVVYILAAVEYPIQDFLARVRGLSICARLAALGLAAALPVYLVMGGLLEQITVPEGEAALSGPRLVVGLLATTCLSVIAATLMAAAAAFALKKILGSRR